MLTEPEMNTDRVVFFGFSEYWPLEDGGNAQSAGTSPPEEKRGMEGIFHPPWWFAHVLRPVLITAAFERRRLYRSP